MDVVILVGLQATGKSSFFEKRFALIRSLITADPGVKPARRAAAP